MPHQGGMNHAETTGNIQSGVDKEKSVAGDHTRPPESVETRGGQHKAQPEEQENSDAGVARETPAAGSTTDPEKQSVVQEGTVESATKTVASTDAPQAAHHQAVEITNNAAKVATSNTQGAQAEGQREQAGPMDYAAVKSDELLQLAREAFWQNKKDKSAAIYKILVQRDPDSLAYKGELANVYWHQNKQEDSAALYAEIAMPMIKQGKTKEVANMLGFIGVFFPDKAREIHRTMTEQ